MQLPDEVVDDVRKRLRRVAGQVQGVERMLAEGRELLGDVGGPDLGRHQGAGAGGVPACRFGSGLLPRDPEDAEADGYPIDEVQRMFMKLA